MTCRIVVGNYLVLARRTLDGKRITRKRIFRLNGMVQIEENDKYQVVEITKCIGCNDCPPKGLILVRNTRTGEEVMGCWKWSHIPYYAWVVFEENNKSNVNIMEAL